jgi:hypothetical protein
VTTMPPRRLHLTVLPQVWHERPKTRGDCENMPRPCPWLSCRHHLALVVNVTRFSQQAVRSPFAGVMEGDLSEMKQTCSLDVADDGEHTLEEVADVMGVTRQRVEAIEHVAQQRAREKRRAGEAKAEWRVLLTRR